jgi:hypothetical protein
MALATSATVSLGLGRASATVSSESELVTSAVVSSETAFVWSAAEASVSLASLGRLVVLVTLARVGVSATFVLFSLHPSATVSLGRASATVLSESELVASTALSSKTALMSATVSSESELVTSAAVSSETALVSPL